MSTTPVPSKITLGSAVVVKLDHRYAKRGVLRAAIVNAVQQLQDGTRAYDLCVYLQVNDMASRHAPNTILMAGAKEGTKEGQCQLVGAAWPTAAKVAAAAPKVIAPPVAVADAAVEHAEDPTVMVQPGVAAAPAPVEEGQGTL